MWVEFPDRLLHHRGIDQATESNRMQIHKASIELAVVSFWTKVGLMDTNVYRLHSRAIKDRHCDQEEYAVLVLIWWPC